MKRQKIKKYEVWPDNGSGFSEVNSDIECENNDGWVVKSFKSNYDLSGQLESYITILFEKED